MLNFNQQQEPGLFPAISALEHRVHGVVPYVLGACCAVGGYFWGIGQHRLPVALCIALGLVVGLLLVPLLTNLAQILLGAVIVAVAALATYWLLNNDATLKQPRPAAAAHSDPAPASPGWLDDLLREVHQ